MTSQLKKYSTDGPVRQFIRLCEARVTFLVDSKLGFQEQGFEPGILQSATEVRTRVTFLVDSKLGSQEQGSGSRVTFLVDSKLGSQEQGSVES